MGQGNFKQPPEGPKIGPTKDYKDIPDEKKRELGDLAAAANEGVFKPATLDPRVAEEEMQQPMGEVKEDSTFADVASSNQKVQQAAQQFDALRQVIANEEEEERAQAEQVFREAALPTDDDKENFFRAILGSRRYEKVYELFGGMVKVTMIELTPGEEEHIFTEMGKAQVAGAVTTEDDWAVLFERLRLMHSVKEIQHSGQDSYLRDPDSENLNKIVYTNADAFVSKFSGAVLYQSLMQVSRLFRTQLDLMVEAATSPDFWIVGGPDSQPRPQPEEPSTTDESLQQVRGGSLKESSSPVSNGS
jgi:hypothetical protein